MKVRALVSFAGKITMGKGEVRDINDKFVLDDLLQTGYVEEVKPNEEKLSKKKVKANEN